MRTLFHFLLGFCVGLVTTRLLLAGRIIPACVLVFVYICTMVVLFMVERSKRNKRLSDLLKSLER